MQHIGVTQHTGVAQGAAVAQRKVPAPVRFLSKLVLDILPAALASVIGGFLFTQYQFVRPAAPRPGAEQAAPASAEMIQLVRDEHAMILDFLKAQQAAEQRRVAVAEQADANAATDAKTAAATHRAAAAVVASTAAPPRNKAAAVPAASAVPVAVPAHTPLVIARVELDESAAPVATTAHDRDSLVAKTLAIKDDVLAATWRVVSAIGGIPSWIASMGDRIGGGDADFNERQWSAS